jgi:hypothetical protein
LEILTSKVKSVEPAMNEIHWALCRKLVQKSDGAVPFKRLLLMPLKPSKSHIIQASAQVGVMAAVGPQGFGACEKFFCRQKKEKKKKSKCLCIGF